MSLYNNYKYDIIINVCMRAAGCSVKLPSLDINMTTTSDNMRPVRPHHRDTDKENMSAVILIHLEAFGNKKQKEMQIFLLFILSIPTNQRSSKIQ